MSETDTSNKTASKLNVKAAEWKPAEPAAKVAAPTQAPKNNYNNSGRAPAQNNYNNRNNNRGNMQGMQMNANNAPYYPPQQQFVVSPQQEVYIYHMQELAASQGLMYDPMTHTMIGMMPNGVAYVAVPLNMMPPLPDFNTYMPMVGTEVVVDATTVEEGEVTENETQGSSGETASFEEAAAVATEPATVETVAAPASAAATGKYVPPNRSATTAPGLPTVTATTTATTTDAAVEQVTQKAAALTIATEDDDADVPVDIEARTGESLRYPKQAILALFNSENVTIPSTFKDFYKQEDFDLGTADGSKYFRAPLASIVTLAESGAAFGGQTPGRGKGSSNNLRGNASSSNLERSTSTSSFGGNNRMDNNRRNNNNNRDRDHNNRENGELQEGEEGFVAYDDSNPAPRENRKNNKKNNNNLPPAVYKSRFQLDANDPLAIMRKANEILNKLSITNFDKLSDQFLALLQSDATTEDSMRRGVEALVTKAQMEENFCFLYADLCRKLIDTWMVLEPEDNTFSTAVEEAEEGETAAPAAAAAGEDGAVKKELRTMGKIFKEALLQRCQNEFEFDNIAVLKEIRENTELSPDERNEKEILLKKRITGHMRFIGELYMKDLIKANVIKSCCLDELIESVQEEDLVCLCKLFQTIGARIEKYYLDKSRQKKNKSKNLQDILPAYFERILTIGNTHPSSRVRFMMRDLADMRSNDWTARREEEKMTSLDKEKKVEAPAGQEYFKPVGTPYVSGDARNTGEAAAPAADDWSVVQTAGKKKTSAAPSPVPPAAQQSMSRSNSSAQMARGGGGNTSSGNLAGMDKRRQAPNGGNAAGASASGPGAGMRKEKSNGGKSARGGNGARGDSVSPVPTAASAETAEVAIVTFTSDLEVIIKKVRSAAKEFYRNNMLEEATLTFEEVNPLPTLMADVVKDLILQCVELSSEKNCADLCGLLAALRTVFVGGSAAPVLSPEQAKEGVMKFLHVVDELSVDVPKAGSLGAMIIGNLVSKGLLSLDLFVAVPEENDFSMSSKVADTVLAVVKELAAQSGAEVAGAQFAVVKGGLDLASKVNAHKQTPEEALAELAAKYNVAFILV